MAAVFPMGGLVSYWPLDEAGGTRADLYGASDFLDTTSVAGVPGKIGNSAQFHAASVQFLRRADPAPLGDEDFTYTLWFKRATTGIRQGLLGKDGPGARCYSLDLINGVHLTFYFQDGGGAQVTSLIDLNNTIWHFMIAWHDAAADTINLQLDAGPVVSRPTNAAYPPAFAAIPVSLGLRGFGGDISYFDGLIDEVALWRRVLTVPERAALWNDGAGLRPPPPATITSGSLVDALRDRLLTLAPVTAAVGERIYTLQFPQSLTAPALRLQEIDRVSTMQLRGDVGIRRARVQIDAVESAAHGDPYNTAHALAAAVRGDLTSGAPSGLVGYRGDLSGRPIAGILAADQREEYDAPSHLVRVSQDFIVWFQS